ncbi:MAG: ribosome silencing factor [Ignavibacteria bacterium]|jgi:ribosome-associated protein
MESNIFVDKIVEIILSKKGYNIKVLDLSQISGIADRFIICSADSDTQVKAIADDIDKQLRKQGIKCYNKEGYDSLRWVLLDYFDVVVHVFKVEARNFYNLEKLWSDAPVIIIEDDQS